MTSIGLNKWIVSGHLGADAQIKTVDLRSGEKAQVASATLYVRRPRDRNESFTVRLSIWEKSSAWRALPFLKKGSLIICTGSVEPNPYISHSDNSPKAGMQMTVLDIDLDTVRDSEEAEDSAEMTALPLEGNEAKTPQEPTGKEPLPVTTTVLAAPTSELSSTSASASGAEVKAAKKQTSKSSAPTPVATSA